MAKPGGTTLLIITAIVLIGGGFGARELIVLRADAAIERHRKEIAYHTGCKVMTSEPPVPHPWGTDNAWDLLLPALDALYSIRTVYVQDNAIDEGSPEFEARGDFENTTRVLDLEAAHFEACRRAAGRSDRAWNGPVEGDLPLKGGRAAQHLCTKAYLSWKQGRDAEAVDGLITALTVAQETARFDQPHAEESLRAVERWAFDAARLLLSKHGLTSAQLEDFGRRLDRLRSTRPRSLRQLRWWSASTRDEVLERWADLGLIEKTEPGWNDLGSERVRTARILNGLGDAAKEAESTPWTSSAELETRWEVLGSSYRKADVQVLWTSVPWYQRELVALVLWDFLRIAVGVARFEAANGRMPATADEAGVGGILRRPVTISGSRLIATPPPQHRYAQKIEPGTVDWEIRRR